MSRLMLAILPILIVGQASSQTRPQTPSLACGSVQQIVASRGATVLGTGGFTYDRFVRDRTFCQREEYTEPAFVPAADTPQCFAGYRCLSGPREDFFN